MPLTPVVVTGTGIAVSGLETADDLLAAGARPDGAADPARRLTGRGLRYRDRATKLALVAAGAALRDGGVLGDDGLALPAASVGVVVSTNYGNLDTVCETVSTIAAETYTGTSPMKLPGTASNVTASWVAIGWGLQGPNLTLCNGPTSGLDALHWARMLLAAGRARAVLVVGVEPANGPARHVAHGDRHAGTPMLDGAAALVLWTTDGAAAHGVPARATIGGYARRRDVRDAVHAVAPDGARLWLRPESTRPLPFDAPPHHDARDLAGRLGHCSGALGVVQAAAGVAWLGRGGTGSVLATAGLGAAGGEDAGAALLLTGAGR
ncbi:beta-ketoacyl synthase N-terminal-like domain-containing protein [Catenuloplanes indicus]|uniref:3-oxoacyl-[acyl-carrier-protein] synthase II n=1 Tax=Catenuloplanes indicus TaxID=137267 RepID=A0AAE3VV63_9ACTN|nr:beta-ketoacyl synthase N-terminal-like domain-containing protein [Catenuloplanes indicus]MDQ0363899.1 3-oxoacyl-[acyl-carrier-protein] synthase II [Catenuloplanes indicus]